MSVSIALWLHRGKDYYNPTNQRLWRRTCVLLVVIMWGVDLTLRGHWLTTCELTLTYSHFFGEHHNALHIGFTFVCPHYWLLYCWHRPLVTVDDYITQMWLCKALHLTPAWQNNFLSLNRRHLLYCLFALCACVCVQVVKQSSWEIHKPFRKVLNMHLTRGSVKWAEKKCACFFLFKC